MTLENHPELLAYANLAQVRPAEGKSPLVSVEAVAGGLLCIAPHLDHVLFNRVLLTPGPASAVDRALAWALGRYARSGVGRYLVQVPAQAHGAYTQAALAAAGLAGFRRHWVQLERGVARLPEAAGGHAFRPRPARPDEGEAVADLLVCGFDLPAHSGPLFAALVQRPGWHVHVVEEAGRLLGAGLLFVTGRVGYFAFAATASDQRGRGVQRALIASRLALARELGCTRLCSETGEAVAGEPQPSMHNLQRAGFRVAGRVLNYVPAGTRWGTQAPAPRAARGS